MSKYTRPEITTQRRRLNNRIVSAFGKQLEPRFAIGQVVKWMGQDGPKVGTITRITHPENSGYVIWVGNEEIEDFPLAEFSVEAL